MSYMKTTVTPDTASAIWDQDKWEKIVKTLTDVAITPTGTITPMGTTTTISGTPTPYPFGTHPTVSTPKVKTLVSKKRMNKGTLAKLGPTASFNKVKQQLAKDLLAQLMNAGVIKIESEMSAVKGSVTFTASVVVNETA